MAQYKEVPKVGFGKAVKLFFSNYTNFSGRSRRSEFWWALLFTNLVNVLLTALLPEIVMIWSLVILLPSLSLTIRRLHDTGHNGWYYLFFLIPIVGGFFLLAWYCTDSKEDNQWGPNPKNAFVVDAVPAGGYSRQVTVSEIPVQLSQPNRDVSTVYVSNTVAQPKSQPRSYVTLNLRSGPMAGTIYRYPAGSTVILGRSAQKCNLVLSQYSVVSGTHCRIDVADQYITVTDLGSTNGTFVNGIPLTPNKGVRVLNGSTLNLANSSCSFQVQFQ